MLPRIAEVPWKTIGWVLGLLICNPISVLGMNAIQFVAAPQWARSVLIGLFGLGLAAFYGWFALLFWLPGRFIREVFGDRQRGVLLFTFAGTVFVWGATPLGTIVYERQREKGLAAVRMQAQPIIAALELHNEKAGKYPAELSDLVPKYLAAIPRNGLTVFPEFHYSRGTEETLYRSYELSIPTPRGLMSFDRYLFWPERKYPEMYGRNGMVPIGDWVFMVE